MKRERIGEGERTLSVTLSLILEDESVFAPKVLLRVSASFSIKLFGRVCDVFPG